MSEGSGGLIIKVSGDLSSLESQLHHVGKSILSFLGVKGALATAGLAAVSAIAVQSIKVGMAFEKQMSAVKAISTATNEELKLMADKAKEMSTKSIFSATEIAHGYEAMAFAGWEAHEMLGAVEGVTNLAAASGEDLKSISDVVTDSMIAFGLSSRDTAVMLKNTNHFVDVLAKTAAKSNTNIGKLGQAFKFVAPIAGAAGYKIEDVSLALGLMGDQAIKSGQAGRYLRAIISRLVAPPAEARKSLEKLGISFADSEGKARPLYDVILDLRESFKSLSEQEQISAARSIAGQNAMSGLLAITNTTDENFARLYGHLQNTNDAAKEMAEVRLDNLSGKWAKLMNTLKVAGIDMYEKSKPALEGLVDLMDKGLKKWQSYTEDVKKKNDETEKSVKTWVTNTKSSIEQWVKDTGTAFSDWATRSSNSIKNWFNETSNAIAKWSLDMVKNSRFDATGGNIINGIIDGMTGKKNFLESSINNLGGNIVSWFEKKLKIGSPSKVMSDLIGKNISLGIADGIDDSTKDVLYSTNKQKNQILNSYGDVFSNLRRKFNFQYNSMFSSVPSLASPILNSGSANSMSTTNAPTINFYGDSNDPDVIARKVRDIFEFGL